MDVGPYVGIICGHPERKDVHVPFTFSGASALEIGRAIISYGSYIPPPPKVD